MEKIKVLGLVFQALGVGLLWRGSAEYLEHPLIFGIGTIIAVIGIILFLISRKLKEKIKKGL